MTDNRSETTTLGPERRKVTRACDECKRRKVKCDGRSLCARCATSNVACTYAAAYNRMQGRHAPYGSRQPRNSSSHDVDARNDDSSGLLSPSSGAAEVSQLAPTRASSDPPETDENSSVPTGDASVHAFLQKVSGHLAGVGRGLPRRLFKRHEERAPQRDSQYGQTLILPDKGTAKSYVDAYFEHGNATCRFLPPRETYLRLDQLYSDTDAQTQDQIERAIILLVIGTGCVWTASWKNEAVSPWRVKACPFLQAAEPSLEKASHSFPPTLEVIQAQVLKCQCELVLGRFNSAWMSLGSAIRLSQMIDIQREQAPLRNIVEAHHARLLFWAIFMIDRYLAVILGRPLAINEHDITVSLPSQLPESDATQMDTRESKLLLGSVAHYRLVKIIGHAVSQLYSRTQRDHISTERTVNDLEEEIQQWLIITPQFFHPGDSSPARSDPIFYDLPWILKRQQRTVQSAFFFANMLIYRGYLLQEFINQNPRSPDRVQKCVKNAMAMLSLAGEFGVEESGYNGTFWITSHFIFCAISILLVYLTICHDQYDRETIERVVEAAMKFHRKLDSSTNINAQRLLDESRSRAQIVRNTQTPSVIQRHSFESQRQPGETDSSPASNPEPAVQDSILWRSLWSQQHQAEDVLDGSRDTQREPQALTLPFATADHFNMIMDIGFDNTIFPDAFAQGGFAV
ncbi:fungal-specific transcription factor domain-containing protein [Bisporella sp. PMI_857]|nr:fungal-specific transcription factor domain-containing protein [Bisporella sp. PMI_857]